MVRPPARAAPPQTKTPAGAHGLGSPQGFSLGAALKPQLLLRCAAGATPTATPRAFRHPRPCASALLAAASHFLGPKSILQRVERSQARSRLPATPPPTISLDQERGSRPRGRGRIPRAPPPPAPCHPTGIVVILFLTLLSPRLSNEMVRETRLEGERGKGAR